MIRDLPPAVPPRASPTDGEACDAFDLVAMTQGELPAAELERIWIHVDACPRCADVVKHLGATQPPMRCGRYELQAPLGAGGMGVVYAAWDPQLRRRVALKLVHPDTEDPNAHARMLREARALARINHPNVVAVFDVGEQDGEIYLATELVEGETLATWQRGKPPAQIVDAWLQVARGLAAAHREGVVHRDVKPTNCLVDREGRVRIGDFGLAREPYAPASPEDRPAPRALGSTTHGLERDDPDAPARTRATESSRVADEGGDVGDERGPAGAGSDEPAVTAAGKVVGTLGYMPPEQRRGVIDPRSDQFALCVALTEALTAERPRANATIGIAALPALGAVLTRGLAARVHERYASMDELAVALAAAIAPPGAVAAGAPPSGRGRAPYWAVAAIAVGALAAMLALALRRSSTEPACEPSLPPTLWSAERRAAVARALPGNVGLRIDAYLERWRDAARAVCRAGGGVQARGPTCLRDAAERLDRKLSTWLDRKGSDATPLQLELDELPEPSRCTKLAWLPEAPTPAQAAAIDAARAPLAARRFDDANVEAAASLTAAAAPKARAAGYSPFAAELALDLAWLRGRLKDPDGALAALRDAEELAVASGDLASQVRLMMARVPLVGAAQPDQAVALAARTREVIARAGGDDLFEAQLEVAVAKAWGLRRRWDEATPRYERARGALRAAFGAESHAEAGCAVALAGAYYAKAPQSELAKRTWEEARAMLARLGEKLPMPAMDSDPRHRVEYLHGVVAEVEERFPGSDALAYAEYALATAYVIALDDERALVHYRKQIELAERIDLRDAQRADGMVQAALILIERGRPAEAVPLAQRAVVVATELGAQDELAIAHKAYGWALLETGSAAAARPPLEQALAMQDAAGVPAQHRGYTRFLLARALWPSPRAKELVHAARADFVAALEVIDADDPLFEAQRKMTRERLAQVEAFLARAER